MHNAAVMWCDEVCATPHSTETKQRLSTLYSSSFLLLQVALANEQKKRAADRAGRIRAEQRLKELNLQLAQLRATAGTTGSNGVDSSSHSSTSGMQTATCGAGRREPAVYPFTPIGVLRSCFSVRCAASHAQELVNGTCSQHSCASVAIIPLPACGTQQPATWIALAGVCAGTCPWFAD